MRALNFQEDISSIPFDNLKNHWVLVFDLTSRQDATENCHYLELVGESLRLELCVTFTLEHDTELIVLGERMFLVAVDNLVLLKTHLKWIMFLSSKESTVYHYSSIGTVGLFLLTMFQLLAMTLLPL